MSAVSEKQEIKVNRREERDRKAQQERKKIRTITIIVVCVFVVLVAAAMVFNSKFLRRSTTAINIGGVDFTATEFGYFYRSAYMKYADYMESTMGEYAADMLPDTSKSHASQIQNAETGDTWEDFFNTYAIEMMTGFVKHYNAAKTAEFVLPEESRAEIDAEIEQLKQLAPMYGYTFGQFLQANYGASMDEKNLRGVMEFVKLADAYSVHYRDSFTYTPERLTAYYAENKSSLDSYTYRYFLVREETVSEADYPDEAELEQAKTAALEASYARAAEIAESITSEADFIAAAAEYSEEYAEPDSTLRLYSGTLVTGTYEEWVEAPEREYGDVTTSDMTTGSYVLFFVNRDPNEYQMVNMRQLRFQREAVDASTFAEGEADPAYTEAVDSADAEALARAETAEALFIEGGATEEKLIELMAEHSDDTTEGGLYENISHMSRTAADTQIVPEIEEWLFAPGRAVGDYELIYTEKYGYHLVYFTGYSERYCDFLADDGLRSADYTAWEETLPAVEAVKTWAFALV